jgi:hypothetical protein
LLPVRRAAVVTVILVLAGISAGCGGGGGGGGRLTRQELASRANRICAEADRKSDALGNPTTPEELAKWADDVGEIGDDFLADMRALSPPEDVQDDFDRVAEIGDAADERDSARIRELVQESVDAEEETDRLARRFGANECAEDD